MSTTYDGHNTWVRFAKQVALGSVADTAWHLWDTGEAEGLTFGETPDDRGILYGERGKRRGAKRQGMQLPGGALPAYPWNQDGSSVALSLILQSFWQGSVVAVLSAGTDGTVYRQTFNKGTQLADTAWLYLTYQVQTGIAKKGEVYLDSMTNGLEVAWEAAGHLTITPTVKALTASRDGTITGTGNPITDGFVMAPKIAFQYNGNAIYPASFNLSLDDGIPDRQGGASRGRQSMHLGDFTGQLSIGVWRDSNTDTYFRAPFDDADPTGTLTVTWTIGTAYGSHCDDTAFHGTITAYIAPDWLDTPAQPGDLIDTFTGDVLQDTTMSISSELNDI